MTLIIEAMLSMTGRVTMPGLSRWTEKGGSYRTAHGAAVFKEKIEWSVLRWQLIKQHTQETKGTWLLIGDEVMVTKSGKETHGLGTFFSSIYNKPLPGLCFLNLSLLSVDNADSLPFNHGTAVELSPFQIQLQACFRAALTLTELDLGIVYFVYDGALGNNVSLQTVKQAGLHLIYKLRHDSKLYFPYTGEYSGKEEIMVFKLFHSCQT